MISSPPEDDRHILVRLTKYTDKYGKTAFEVIHIHNACKNCVARGLIFECEHQSLIIGHQSTKKMGILKEVYKEDQEEFRRELRGEIIYRPPYFRDILIQKLREKERYTRMENDTINEIFVSYDPNGNGGSEMGITSFYWTKDYEKNENRLVVRNLIFIVIP